MSSSVLPETVVTELKGLLSEIAKGMAIHFLLFSAFYNDYESLRSVYVLGIRLLRKSSDQP